MVVTAQLPAFAQPGQLIDVTVSSVGNAKSLRGGTLLLTPLRGVDGEIYAVAQGNVVVGGAGASAGGSKVQINHLSAGRIPNGASVERVVPNQTLQGESIRVELNRTDFSDVQRVTEAINRRIRMTAGGGWPAGGADGCARGGGAAAAGSGTPGGFSGGAGIDGCGAVGCTGEGDRECAHGFGGDEPVGGAGAQRGGARKPVGDGVVHAGGEPAGGVLGRQTVAGQVSDITVRQEGGAVMMLPKAAQLKDLVRALNTLGATPQDLIAILQALQAAGSLKAEIEII